MYGQPKHSDMIVKYLFVNHGVLHIKSTKTKRKKKRKIAKESRRKNRKKK